MRLFLIRHAQSENNARPSEERVEDPSITALGREQAELLGQSVAQLELTRLITSPFRRTLETAEFVRQATGLAPEVRVDLHELGGCVAGVEATGYVGRPGMTRGEIQVEFPEFDVTALTDDQGWWRSKPYEGYAKAQARASRLLNQTCVEFGDSDENVAYVMHADIKMLMLACCEGFQPVQVPYNVSVSELSIRGTDAHISEYNGVSHLPSGLLTT